MKIDRFQRNAIIICVLPIIALAIANYTQRSHLTREIYLIRDGIIFLLWGLSFLWRLVNAIFILTNQKNAIYKEDILGYSKLVIYNICYNYAIYFLYN